MFKSNLKYNYNDQTKQVINEAFKELETLINSSSDREKKEQYAKRIVDIFKRTLNSDVNI